MEGSKDGQGNHPSEEFQEESGLELSLGLGLSSADSRQKWKASEGPAACSLPSVEQTGEPSLGCTFSGMNAHGKLKPSSKASGLNAALKKFLEGRLDEQDESNKLLDASNSFNLQKEKEKEKEKSASLGSQDRSGQQLEVGLDMDSRGGKPFLFKDLQVLSGQSPTHTSPLLMDALKMAPLGSNLSSPSSAEGLAHFNGEDGTQEGSETHKNFEEAQKKRTLLIEEHEHHKKGKKEDQPGVHAMMQSQNIELSMKGLPSLLPNKQKDGQVSILGVGREGDKAGSPSPSPSPSPLQRLIEKVPSETSSASTDGTEKLEEKGHGGAGEASSSAPKVMVGSEKIVPASASAAPFFPYPVAPYPVMAAPYPLPGSTPSASGPSSSEGSPWMQAKRPPVGVRFTNAGNGALYSRNAIGMVEDANNRLQGNRVHNNGSGNSSVAGGAPSFQNHSFFCTVARNSTQDPQLQQGPDAQPHPSLPIPAVPHFSSQLPMSDHGELRAVKEQGSMATLPRFVAQPLPGDGARPPSSSGVKEDGGQSAGKKMEHGHHRAMAEPSNSSKEAQSYGGPEELRRVMGVQFQQGSTENVSVWDGLGEDMALLQHGIAPGLKFGGSGTPPDLPWVYTTGTNGQAVGGVLYRLSRTQLKVVCACHGKHMSPAEFTQHARSSDIASADKNAAVNSSPPTSQAT